MKITITKPQEIDVKFLHVSAGVRYWEDATVDGIEDEKGGLIPCRVDDRWEPTIDIESGQIIDWEKGRVADIHYKVCDDGVYKLSDKDQKVLFEVNDYVPAILQPEGNGYGDYIIMKVDENGFIQNWKKEDIHDLLRKEE